MRPVLIHPWIKFPGDNWAHRLKKLNVRFVPKADIRRFSFWKNFLR